MIFITEDDIRARAPQAGEVFTLGANERLTPSAAEYAAQLRLRVKHDGKPASGQDSAMTKQPQAEAPAGTCSQEMTHLDRDSVVGKNHPAIIMRGRLDSLLALTVLAQTQFDPKNRLPVLLKECLAELHGWILQTLAAEVGGTAFQPAGMAGMDTETLHLVSREPKQYLGQEHFAAEAALGGNIALLNWLRAQVRETEVTAVACSGNLDVVCSLNRLSSAVYVLMLLTLAAERGQEIGAKKA